MSPVSGLHSKQIYTYVFGAAELGSVFYSVKEKNFDERGNRRQADREFSRRVELEAEMARQREEYVSCFSVLSFGLIVHRVGLPSAQKNKNRLQSLLVGVARGLLCQELRGTRA